MLIFCTLLCQIVTSDSSVGASGLLLRNISIIHAKHDAINGFIEIIMQYQKDATCIGNFVYLPRFGSVGSEAIPCNNTCCLQSLKDSMITTSMFAERAICNTSGGHVSDLHGDYNAGTLTDMSKESSIIPGNASVVGFDVVTFRIAEHDIHFIGMRKDIEYHFAAGIACIAHSGSGETRVTFEQVSVSFVAGSGIVCTSPYPWSTEQYRISDLIISLSQVWSESYGFKLFLRLMIVVGHNSSAGVVQFAVPVDRIAISKDLDGGATHPCRDSLSEHDMQGIADVSDHTKHCFMRETVCKPEMDSSNVIEITVPLQDNTWNTDTASPGSLSLSFTVTTRSTSMHVQKTVPVSNLRIHSMCKTIEHTPQNVEELVSVSVLLGLTPSYLIQKYLVENIRIQQPPGIGTVTELNQTASSSPSGNIMTFIVTGDRAYFSDSFAQSFSVRVDDIVTIHILDPSKYQQVLHLMHENKAFIHTVHGMTPSPLLLNICPFMAISKTYGCISRRDVTQGVIIDGNDIIDISDCVELNERTGCVKVCENQ